MKKLSITDKPNSQSVSKDTQNSEFRDGMTGENTRARQN